ncbi:type II secretion system F family protein [Agaribacter flavus]|uniref:Type II secretion system F family protein n=1 Tax=Agaribacter flavus TaxID=1902781 RepID=A0ABV7FWF1_9ALTE
MPAFHYQGRNTQGDLVTGVVDALDETNVAKSLLNQNIVPVKITPDSAEKASESNKHDTQITVFTPKVKLEDLIIFCRQMYSLTKSGIPIVRSVSSLAMTKSIRLTVALKDVVGQLEKGRNLSSALAAHPDIFGQLFVSIVHVGENTGQLDQAFLQLALYLEREQETRKQIKSATRYPVFVVIALVAAFVIMNIFVIPVFADMFSKFDSELPLMTRGLLATSEFMLTKWYILVGALLILVIAARKYVDTEIGQIKWDRFKLSAPIVGDIIERSLLGRFARSFSMMLNAGVPLTSVLSLAAESMGNAYMSSRIIEMRRKIEKGESLSRVAKSSELFTPLVLQMIAVGEETGRLDELLEEVADFYEREVEYDIKTLTSKIEPILISVVAVMVLILALGIFTPMWDMMGAIR